MENQGNKSGPLAEWGDWRKRNTLGTSARETAYRIIRDKIIYLDLKPGEALSDRVLAEELEMSRTPVREALIILSTTNMVVLRPQSGTFVAPIDEKRMEAEQFLRYVLEKEILTLACQHMDEPLRQRYRENLHLHHFYFYESSESLDREKRLLELDNEFHRIAFAAVGREDNFFHVMDMLQHIERLRSLSLVTRTDDNIHSDHQRIVSALSEGDLKTVLYWLEIHMNRYKEHLKGIKKQFPQYFSLEV